MDFAHNNIRFYSNIGHSPAWPMTIDAVEELRSKGLAPLPHYFPVYSDPCLTWEDADGVALGFLCYRYDDTKASWFILLAYVGPDYRRHGIHTALFEALVERAKMRDDILTIECGTDVNNKDAQAAFVAQGRKPTGIYYEYRLKDFANGKSHLDKPQQ